MCCDGCICVCTDVQVTHLNCVSVRSVFSVYVRLCSYICLIELPGHYKGDMVCTNWTKNSISNVFVVPSVCLDSFRSIERIGLFELSSAACCPAILLIQPPLLRVLCRIVYVLDCDSMCISG